MTSTVCGGWYTALLWNGCGLRLYLLDDTDLLIGGFRMMLEEILKAIHIYSTAS